MSKELVFKVVMQGDTNNFDTSIKKSKQTAEQMFQSIGMAVEEFDKKSKKISDSTKNIVTTEAQDRVKDLTSELNAATNVIVAMGDKSTISATEIRSMSQQSQQAISTLKDELVAAQAEFLQLSQAKASPQELGEAIGKITDIKRAIRDVETAFGAYQTVATNAMTGVTNAASITITEIQKFTSVDLTLVVSEAQSATRAIESMGEGAVISTKEVQRIGQLGSTAVESLTRELSSARKEWEALSHADGVTLEELTAAKERVQGLERALNLTESSMNEFKGAAQQAIPVVDNLDHSLDGANQELKETESLSQKVSSELAGLRTGLNAVTGALAALGIGATAQEIAQTADEWSNLNARVKIAVGTHGDVKAAMADVIDIARTTNSNLTATGDLYARLTKIGQEMKIPQEQVVQLTKTISQAIQVSGGSAASAEAAITQFQQALASGVLRGDEFNSMMEQSPRLMQALADGLKVTTGELRKLAGEGKLTTDVVTKAMLSQSATIQKEFEQFPTTIGNSIENLKTSWTVFIGELDQTHGVSAKVAESLKWVAENLDEIFTTLKLAGQAFIAYKALNIASVFMDKAAGVRAASVAISQESAAVIANTEVQLANAAATRANATSKTGLAATATSSAASVAASSAASATSVGALIGRLGALGVAVTAFGLLVPTVMQPVGSWIGGGLAKQVEKAEMAWHNLNAAAEDDKRYMTAIEQLEFQMQNEAVAAKVSADMKKEIAAAAEKGAAKTYELSKASQELVTKFNQLVKDGKPTSEALKEVGESMKFDSLTGINNAVSALNMLQRTGKITAQELRAELKSALVNEDLVVFQTNAKAAFAGTAQEANKMAQVTQVAMELALERTGLSTEQLQGKFSKAFQSASNDIQTVFGHLDEYKAQGIDTGLALSASLNKAIDTAQSRKELDYVKAKLVEYGNQGKISSEQVALGLTLVEQKAGSLSKALDPVNAAFAAMGIKTKNELDGAATSAEKNFDVIKKSGQATSEGLKQAYQKMVDEVVASGDQVRIARVKAIGESNGLNLEIDKSGKAVVKTTQEIVDALYPIGDAAENSTRRATGGFRELGRVAREEAQSTADEWEAAMKKVDAERKAQAASTAKGLGQAMDDMNAKAKDYEQRLIAAGMDSGQAKSKADKALQAMLFAYRQALTPGSVTDFSTPLLKEMEDTLKYWEGKKSGSSGSSVLAGGNSAPNIQAPTIESPKMPSSTDIGSPKTQVYRFEFNGNVVELTGDPSQQDLVNDLFTQLEQAKKRM
ncbi:tape measure protein [Acinetobacter courvalinii]|uniref:tape measure protein n=1 Tax=Acinetobacter courvalinii TaxID=280147 RepID=UPI002899601D|nr:tape measure protein [Acinetobacter courvalinii]